MLQDAVDEYIMYLENRMIVGETTNHNTVMAYRNDLRQLCGYLKQQDLDNWSKITPEHMASYLAQMRDELAYQTTTIVRKLAALKSFFRYMRNNNTVLLDPLENVEAPRVQKALPQILNADQIGCLFEQVQPITPGGMRDLAILHLLYATGMRVSEIVALNVGDFDAQRATISCRGRISPTKRSRVLSLAPIAISSIQHYLDIGRPRLMPYGKIEQALFLNHHGDRLTRQGFWLIIKGYARKAGIINITPHMLRHSFATMMIQEGMEVRTVQAMLGHANIATTQVYCQIAAQSRELVKIR